MENLLHSEQHLMMGPWSTLLIGWCLIKSNINFRHRNLHVHGKRHTHSVEWFMVRDGHGWQCSDKWNIRNICQRRGMEYIVWETHAASFRCSPWIHHRYHHTSPKQLRVNCHRLELKSRQIIVDQISKVAVVQVSNMREHNFASPLRPRQVHSHYAHNSVDHPLGTITEVDKLINPCTNLGKLPCQMASCYYSIQEEQAARSRKASCKQKVQT